MGFFDKITFFLGNCAFVSKFIGFTYATNDNATDGKSKHRLTPMYQVVYAALCSGSNF